ncbi:MAG: glycosyltransferase [Aulosira sp. ZfuVER01]|nr:glycosyltransferase [Aulosira sp. ZfuVER01]MDZ8000760.1 glycosyltransferase [Aulosira sp. DedVER01a]MDZ8055068.1 glycosyltransferase [Aulosira sp. ZfuCHP01]
MIKKRICLVSPGHVASNPRLVKEANALDAAGFSVRVVAGDYMAAIRSLDQTILSQVPWSCIQVGLGSKLSYLGLKLWQKLAQKVVSTGWIPHLSVATWAHSPMSTQLAKAAAAEPADLYIAHCLAALPAAAIAAQKHHAKLGFDAEDFHVGELPDIPANQAQIRVRDRIERTLLPRCQHLTAASPGIAAAYAKRYGVSMTPILNVFPLAEATPSPQLQEGERFGSEPSLYWFSQTVGPGRGIESIITAMGQMQTRVRLHLRGFPAAGYSESLMQLAAKVRVSDRVHLLPPAPPAEMVRLAAYHDVGLSLELTQPLNRGICLTNKIFVYLLAGLPVLMSLTPAQKEFAQQVGEVAILVDINDSSVVATALDRLFSQPGNLEIARTQAGKLGQEIYNWDIEQKKFLNIVVETLF